MRGIFWNSGGLRELAKHDFLRDTSVEKGLDFIAILKTHRRHFSNECLNTFCGGCEFWWHWTPPNGRSRGILLGVYRRSFDVENVITGDFIIDFT